MTHLLLRLLLCSAALCGAQGIVTAASEPPEPLSKPIDPGLSNAAISITILPREQRSASDAEVDREPVASSRETSLAPDVFRIIQADFARLFQSSDDHPSQGPGNSIQTVSQRNADEFGDDRGPDRDRGDHDRGDRDRGDRDRDDRDQEREQRNAPLRERERPDDRDRGRDSRPPHRGEADADRPRPDHPHQAEAAHARIRALIEAAERLQDGGLAEVAQELRHQAEQMERSLRPEGDHRDEVLRELMHNVHELRREVREVHERLDVVLKQMERSAPEPDPAFRHHDEKRNRGPVRNFENNKPPRDRKEPLSGAKEKRNDVPFDSPTDAPVKKS